MDSKKSFRGSMGSKNGKRGFRNFGFIALLILFGLIIFAAYAQPSSFKTIPFTQVVEEANQGQYQKIEVKGNELTITKKGEDSATLKSFKDPAASLKEEGLDSNKVEVSYKSESSTGSTLASIGISLLPVLLIGALLFFMLRSAQGQGNQ
ncbi:MAG TPA: ATP-dependent metallopeptidase FtsH/Yme1/Tma family protein, partial [Candidatus Saccharimonadales bacterium]|nr:ATP-dependent metallopeptidase FtsH/Yme1/Tma family protein [Candidatus Saccharimonadales bacterium]